jgi:hypothetical protein
MGSPDRNSIKRLVCRICDNKSFPDVYSIYYILAFAKDKELSAGIKHNWRTSRAIQNPEVPARDFSLQGQISE